MEKAKPFDQKMLGKLLAYDPDTGSLTWLPRPAEMFANAASTKRNMAAWNSRYAGKPAFTSLDDHGYFHGSIFGRIFKAHRVIWTLVNNDHPNQIDHINGVRSDNRIVNLRAVSRLENMRNQQMRINNNTGHLGVSWDSVCKQWRARINCDGRNIWLGRHDTFDEALDARKAAEIQFGYHANHGRQPIERCPVRCREA